ncbi:ankyrin repeat domain-containing protein [Paenibacillus sp. MMO-58]|uniref:ankyrin repeat domain-containing protein n=1 Tax=Paenibacillus sp. MMO-58 TaxID=3081290 RepID=UPI0030191533
MIPLVARHLYSAKITQMLLDYTGYDVNFPFNHDNRTLLVDSLKNQGASCDTAFLLIERGADVDSTDKKGFFPLYLAVRNKALVAARKLLEKGANPNRSFGEHNLVSLAASTADYKMLQLLEEFNTDMTALTPRGKKPIELVPNYEQFLSCMILSHK